MMTDFLCLFGQQVLEECFLVNVKLKTGVKSARPNHQQLSVLLFEVKGVFEMHSFYTCLNFV